MARKKKHDDEDAGKQHDDEGTDWLLAQLVTGRTSESEQQPQPPAAAEPPVMPEPAEPELRAAEPDLPLRPPSPRREEVLDWFSLAEPPAPETDAATRALPVVGDPGEVPPAASDAPERPTPTAGSPADPAPGLPAWSPPFVASPPPPPTVRVTQVEPPVGENPPPVEPPPGPVTPTGPFALRWGSNESGSDDSGRAVEPAPREDEPTPPVSGSGETNDPFAGFTPPPVARSSFTPISDDAPRHPTTPDSAPRGWDERAAEPPRPAAYDDELWAALNEPEPETPSPGDPESTPAPPTHPGIALSLPLTPPPAQPAPSAAPTPFPGFASDGGGQPTESPQGASQIDDLLAELGKRRAAREAADVNASAGGSATNDDAPADDAPTAAVPTAATAPSAAGLASLGVGFDGADDAPGDDEPAPEPTGEAPGEAESQIARQVAEAGYFWNLTPDPTAADPDADVVGTAATINRLRATAPEDEAESEPELVWQPEPEPDWQAEAEPEPEAEPEFEWEPAYSETAVEQTEPSPEPSFDHEASDRPEVADEPDDHDPLAALFGGAAATPPPARPAAPLDDPFAHLAPQSSANAAPAAAAAAAAPGATFGAPAGVATGARSAYDVSDSGRNGGSGGGSGTGGVGTQGRRNSPVRILAWIAGSLAAVLVLAGLFFLGTQIGGGAAAPAESPSASTTPTPTPPPTAAQPVGVHAWDSLFGGECLDPFVGPWEEEFTVVDCAAPHAAQLVYRGVLPGDAVAPFPGEAELASQMNLLCTATGVINLAAVAGMEDLQVQASYPVTEAQWAEGARNYYCFANRAGGEPLTASIAGPGPAA